MNLKTIALVLSIALLASCSQSNKKKSKTNEPFKELKADSLELTRLIREAYQWHMKSYLTDFPYKFEKESDSIFTGIDWAAYTKNIALFKKTNYFTREFLAHHKSIATTLDKSIKNAPVKWRNINDGVTIWDSEADDWCNCQDYPDGFWNTLRIDSLKVKNNLASFNLNMKIGNK